jgi:hypothetical protein
LKIMVRSPATIIGYPLCAGHSIYLSYVLLPTNHRGGNRFKVLNK